MCKQVMRKVGERLTVGEIKMEYRRRVTKKGNDTFLPEGLIGHDEQDIGNIPYSLRIKHHSPNRYSVILMQHPEQYQKSASLDVRTLH